MKASNLNYFFEINNNNKNISLFVSWYEEGGVNIMTWEIINEYCDLIKQRKVQETIQKITLCFTENKICL